MLRAMPDLRPNSARCTALHAGALFHLVYNDAPPSPDVTCTMPWPSGMTLLAFTGYERSYFSE